MTHSKMPQKVNQKWPRQFGFEIAGHGPCYVISVDRGNTAYTSGLQPGDQILELDDQDVTSMSAEALKTLAKHSRTQPPTLGVVSRLLNVDIVGNKTMGLGLLLNDSKPVTVKAVEDGGPAQAAGIRPGDIILEANGKQVHKADEMRSYLSSHSRRFPISFIPVGKTVITPTHKPQGQQVSEGSRVKRAKDLHDKMNEILGEDYEKKMAVVGVLKQYAEDRDIDMLARALTVILKTPQHKTIIRQIRPFIPPRQRTRFDEITRQQQQFMMAQEKVTDKPSNSSAASHKVGQRRALQVMRENGSFGFVIKGSNPAYIESVDEKGPAQRAGLQPGDYIVKLNGIDVRKCSHSHLIHLLQDSGISPVVEILRCSKDEVYLDGPLSASSVSSSSSHSDSEWTSADHKLIVDKEGHTFHERAEYLLTRKERAHIRKAYIEYDSTCNIVELFESVSMVLDTPSKKTLWMFILARLSPQHQEYCINQINLPRHVLLEAVEQQTMMRQRSKPWTTDEDSSSQSGWEYRNSRAGTSRVKISSFQQQVEYLLTSRERSMLKKALQLYTENRNVEHLEEDLEVLLDTPSKRTLWMYIIPLLSPHHQDYVRHGVNSKTTPAAISGPQTQRKGKEEIYPYMSSEDDEHELFSKTGVRKMKSKPVHGSSSMKGLDVALLKELEETRRVVKEAKDFFTNGKADAERDKRYITVIPVENQYRNDFHGPFPGARSPHSPLSPRSPSGYHTGLGSANFSNVHSPADLRPEPGSTTKFSFSENHLKLPSTLGHGGFDSEQDGLDLSFNSKVSKFSKMSGDTFNRHALVALKELDAAVAAEVSDLETTDHSNGSGAEDKLSPVKNGLTTPDTVLPVPPPPPPPPGPPPPPPPPPPVGGSTGKEENISTQMNVKRINWEKLDDRNLENTVWKQIGETSDLQDVVRYLELEQYFSTKSPRKPEAVDGYGKLSCSCCKHKHSAGKQRPRVPEKKAEVCILNPKKSYNIAILLGHLKLNISEVRQALYLMDEEILTPELLRQLLAYAPSQDEMEYLDTYSGDIDELSMPDRFIYEMSRVPGYEQRLKALIFKGNFKEKIDEMKEHLQVMRKASLELKHSRRLAKILELILAMGNYMNQGNIRVGEAAGFKIRFLTQLEITKTSDNKFTFLHVLAEAVHNKFPEVLAVGEDLTNVPRAAKVSNVLLNQELQDLRKVLQDISNTLEKFSPQKTSLGINDKFQVVMGHFISQASDEIQSLFRLQANTMEEFHNTVNYFGEDAKHVTTTDLFGVFAEFITKFEKAHRYNMVYKRY